jgi:NhaP-type Na+/H+ or K+/H+ antiporter
MDPRGIVAASTAATFGGALAGMNIPGADALLPATFVVIAGTVAIYGLSAVPAARLLGLANDDSGDTGPVVPGDAMQEDP